jgi:hypothetical protein
MVHLASDIVELQLASVVVHEFFLVFLALLIPGKQSITSKIFDVYLEPLVEEFL